MKVCNNREDFEKAVDAASVELILTEEEIGLIGNAAVIHAIYYTSRDTEDVHIALGKELGLALVNDKDLPQRLISPAYYFLLCYEMLAQRLRILTTVEEIGKYTALAEKLRPVVVRLNVWPRVLLREPTASDTEE